MGLSEDENYSFQWNGRTFTDWDVGENISGEKGERKSKIRPKRKEMPQKTQRDMKKDREVVVNFGKISSMHGIARVCSPKKTSKCSKIFYTILITLCFLSVVLTIVTLLQEMLNKDSTIIYTIKKDFSSGLDADPQYFPEYPRITICRNPSYRIDLNRTFLNLVGYAALSLGYPFVSLNPREGVMIAQLGLVNISSDLTYNPKLNNFKQRLLGQEQRFQVLKKIDPQFNLKKFLYENGVRCENFFSHCLASVESFDCCESFQPVLTSLGLCYTLLMSEEVNDMSRAMDVTVIFTIDLLSPPHLRKSSPRGFYVFFTDPVSEFYAVETSKGEKVVPDQVTIISVIMEKWSREALHTPWHGLTTDCPTFSYKDSTDTRDLERYTFDECVAYFLFAMHRNSCDCESVRHLGNSSFRQCEPFDVYTCLLNSLIQSNMSFFHEACQEPCIQYKYNTQVSFMGFGEEEKTRVVIRYESKSFVYHQYQRTSTISNFISQLGGSLGLYLGASIMTVLEILVFTLSWIWYKMPSFRTSKIQPSSPVEQNEPSMGDSRRLARIYP